MKAVVLEIKNGYAAVLMEDGTVRKLKRTCSVGDTIEVDPAEKDPAARVRFRKPARIIAAAAAALLVTAGAGGGYYMTSTAYASVYVSAGDSQVEISLNHFNRVLNINVDGDINIEKALYDEGIKNSTLQHALKMTARVLQDMDEEDSASPEISVRIMTGYMKI